MKRKKYFLLSAIVFCAVALSFGSLAFAEGDLLSEITGGQVTTGDVQSGNIQTKGGRITTPGFQGVASATGTETGPSDIPQLCDQGDPVCVPQTVINDSPIGAPLPVPDGFVITGGLGAPGSSGPLHVNSGFGDGTNCAAGCFTPTGVLVGDGLAIAGDPLIGPNIHHRTSSISGPPIFMETDSLINQNVAAGNFDAAEQLLTQFSSPVDGLPVEHCGNCR